MCVQICGDDLLQSRVKTSKAFTIFMRGVVVVVVVVVLLLLLLRALRQLFLSFFIVHEETHNTI